MRLDPLRIPHGADGLAALQYGDLQTGDAPILLYAHGFTSSKQSMDGLAAYLALRGRAGIAFDLPGHKLGCSGGEMASAGDAVAACRSAAAWCGAHFDLPLTLVGHSLGAACWLAIARQEMPQPIDLRGIVSIAMGDRPSAGFDTAIGRAMLQTRRDYVAGADVGTIVREFDGLVAGAGSPHVPVLFTACAQDVLVSTDSVRSLAARWERGTFELIQGEHVDAPNRARSTVARWLAENNA